MLFFLLLLVRTFCEARGKYDYVDTVHVVFSNHLDVGYHRGQLQKSCVKNHACLMKSVLNEYWHLYFPFAISVAERIEQDFPHRNVSFSWMTFPWLVELYLNCTDENAFGLVCPTPQAKQHFLDGVAKGYIWFNAFPFNSQLEMYDKSMLEFGINLSRDIMNKTGLPSQWHSRVISQRDVPGMPRSVLPLLKQQGIRAISVGAHGGSTLLNETKIFRWRDVASDSELLYLYHSQGYGGLKLRDILVIPGFNHALVYAWNSDNLGPFALAEVVGIYAALWAEFELYDEFGANVKIFASTFDNWLDALYAADNSQAIIASLPVVTENIGDTWNYGLQSDPFKTAAHRNAQLLRAQCLETGKCRLDSPNFYNFSTLLLKNGEHTFGGCVRLYLDKKENAPDSHAYYNQQFFAGLAENEGVNNFTAMRESWYEQRHFGLEGALEALSESADAGDLQLYAAIKQEWDSRLHNVSIPDLTDDGGWMVANKSQVFGVCDGRYRMAFNGSNGAISTLFDTVSLVAYTQENSDHQLGQFWYQTLNKTVCCGDDNISLPHHYVPSHLLNVYRHQNDSNRFLMEMNMGSAQMYEVLYADYSAVQWMYNRIQFDCEQHVIEMDLDLINKSITRVTETLFFSFNPLNCSHWTISSIEQDMRLNDVVNAGTSTLYSYGTNGNISCVLQQQQNSAGKVMAFQSKDVGLVSFKPAESTYSFMQNEYSFGNRVNVSSSDNDGFAFHLMNNLWSTNYPQWYPFDALDQNITYSMKVFL